jgi:hypothetical protein
MVICIQPSDDCFKACCRKDKGFVPIVKYGEEFAEVKKGRQPRQPVKLLYSNGNHYDLLLPSLI